MNELWLYKINGYGTWYWEDWESQTQFTKKQSSGVAL